MLEMCWSWARLADAWFGFPQAHLLVGWYILTAARSWKEE